MDFKEEEIVGLANTMEDWSPQEILRWSWERYGNKLTMATAFGAEGCAIIAMLAEITKDIYLFNLNTGYQFRETLETKKRLEDRYGIPIHFVQNPQSVAEMENEAGGPLYRSDPDLCCHKRKVIPLSEALVGYDAWITAIRRDQTPQRANTPVIGPDPKFGLVKVNPLVRWTKKDVWDYILMNDVPYNPLHDAGYPSIGCWPCTRSIGVGEDDRAGRWAASAKQECGIHVANMDETAILSSRSA